MKVFFLSQNQPSIWCSVFVEELSNPVCVCWRKSTTATRWSAASKSRLVCCFMSNFPSFIVPSSLHFYIFRSGFVGAMLVSILARPTAERRSAATPTTSAPRRSWSRQESCRFYWRSVQFCCQFSLALVVFIIPWEKKKNWMSKRLRVNRRSVRTSRVCCRSLHRCGGKEENLFQFRSCDK